jgi:hypothetical protein
MQEWGQPQSRQSRDYSQQMIILVRIHPRLPLFQDPVAIASGADPGGENATAVSNDGTIVSQIPKKESSTPSVDDLDHIVRPNFKREPSLSNSDSKRSLTPKALCKSATPVPLKKGAAPVQLIGDLPRAERGCVCDL